MAQDDRDTAQVSKAKDWLHIDPRLATPVQAVLLNNLQVMRDEITDIKGQIADLKLLAQKLLLDDRTTSRQVLSSASTSLDSGETASTSRAPNEQPSGVKVDDLINRHEDLLLEILSAQKAGKIVPLLFSENINFEDTESMRYFKLLTETLKWKATRFSGQGRAEARAAGLKEYGTLMEFRQLSDTQRTTLFTSICDRAAKKEAAPKGSEGDAAKTTGGLEALPKRSTLLGQPAKVLANDKGNAGEPSSAQQSKGTSVGTKRKNVPD